MRGVGRMKSPYTDSLAHTTWECKYHIVFAPKLCISSFMGYLKGKSTLIIFERHANLKYKYGNRAFWCTGYYISRVGNNKTAFYRYVQNQLKEDMMSDQMTIKEYKDPFKGGK